MQEMDLTSGINYRLKANQPMIGELKPQKVLTITIQGDPNTETAKLMPPLYASAYAVRKTYKEKGVVFKVEKLRGRWPTATLDLPKSQWSGIYALPIPDDVTSLPEIKKDKNPDLLPLHIDTWHYGKVGMILHIGSYKTENTTIQKLLKFIEVNNLSIIPGSHEEIYISDPNKTEPDKLKTIILYRLK